MKATSLKLLRMWRMLLLRCAPPAIAVGSLPGLQRWDLAVILVALTIWMLAEAVVENEDTNRTAVSSSHDRGSRLFILGAHILAWWAPLIDCWLWPGPPSTFWFSVGLAVTLAGASLRVIAIHTLGRYFTAHVQVHGDHEVCEKGVYGLVRHPAYVALFLLNIGPSIAARAWVALAVVAAGSLAANRIRVSIEEEALTRDLGTAYLAYCIRVSRWFPSAGRRSRATAS